MNSYSHNHCTVIKSVRIKTQKRIVLRHEKKLRINKKSWFFWGEKKSSEKTLSHFFLFIESDSLVYSTMESFFVKYYSTSQTHTNTIARKQSPISNTVIITSIVLLLQNIFYSLFCLSIVLPAFAFIRCSHQFFSLFSSFFTYPFMSCAFVFFVYLCFVSFTMSTDSLSFSSSSLSFI